MNVMQPLFNREVINKPQTAKNIALQIKRAINESKPAADSIAYKFKGKSKYMTCYNVYEFLRKNVKYYAEPQELQTAQTLPRIVNSMLNGNFKGDCKHYTTFACSILNSLDIPCCMTLISQDYFNASPTHIYCVARINDQNVIVDPCMKRFNNEAKSRYKYRMKF